MLEFTSALGLDRVTTDITLTATIIRIVITITGPTTGTADTVIIIATIVTTIITDIKVTPGSRNQIELARKQFRVSSILGEDPFAAGDLRKKPGLLFWISRLRWFRRRTSDWLINLELFF